MKKTQKAVWSVLLAVILTISLLGGCGVGDSPQTTQSSPKSSQAATQPELELSLCPFPRQNKANGEPIQVLRLLCDFSLWIGKPLRQSGFPPRWIFEISFGGIPCAVPALGRHLHKLRSGYTPYC